MPVDTPVVRGDGTDRHSTARVVLVVDHDVREAEPLLAGLDGRVEIVRLEPGGHGLEQIAAVVSGGCDLSALHVLGHGEPGALRLAGDRIDVTTLSAHRAALVALAGALAPGATVVLYGCSVAAEPQGARFVDCLEAALGAAVAAATGPVGAAAAGGGWSLRTHQGATIEPVFAEAARAGYPGLLALIRGTGESDSLTGSPTVDLIIGFSGDDVLFGLDGNDTLVGLEGNDLLSGGLGEDKLEGGDGNDTLFGGDGSDRLSAGAGSDLLYGGDGADTLYSGRYESGDVNVLYGGLGADRLTSATGNAVLYGDSGNDTLGTSGGGNSTQYGGAGDDRLDSDGGGPSLLIGGDGNDTLNGYRDGDTLSGGSGDDLLIMNQSSPGLIVGGDGNDTIFGDAGSDTMSGGAGNDVFTGYAFRLDGDTIADLGTGDSIVVTGSDLSSLNGTVASGTLDLGGGRSLTLSGITSASGTFAATYANSRTTITLVAAPSSNGGGGDDGGPLAISDGGPAGDTGAARTITNHGGTADSAAIVQNTGNNGNVVMATLPPSISIASSGPSTAETPGEATTTLVTAIQARGSTGEAGLIGGAHAYLDRLASTTTLDVRTIVPTIGSGVTTDDPIVITGSSAAGQSEAFVIDMRAIPDKVLQLDNIEFSSILGNATVTGGSGDNFAVGDDANQFISLGEGDDTLSGGDGNDTIGSGSGNDSLFGDGGDDTVFGGTGLDSLYGGTGVDLVYGNQEADVLYGNQGADTLYGGQDADTVYGGQDADLTYGNLGDDLLDGGLGADTLYGGQGDDLVRGGSGDDTLNGDRGDDTLSGGEGADLFVVRSDGGNDEIADFDGAAGDRMAIDVTVDGVSIDSFTGLMAAASDAADGVRIALGSGNTLTLKGITLSQLQSDWFGFG